LSDPELPQFEGGAAFTIVPFSMMVTQFGGQIVPFRLNHQELVFIPDPFCMSGVICDADNVGRRAVSTDVDHIIPKELGGTDAEENLQGLCHECHSFKTATQDSTFAKRKENQQ
jgi:hypothetical protein